jgi:hypothetical protein
MDHVGTTGAASIVVIGRRRRRRTMLWVSYHASSLSVYAFMSRRKPNTTRSCRTSLESSLATPTVLPHGMSLRAGEFRPPWRHASLVWVVSRDFTRWVRRTFVVLFVESCSSLGHHRLTVGHARGAHCVCSTTAARTLRECQRASLSPLLG